jgi:putative membrane protein
MSDKKTRKPMAFSLPDSSAKEDKTTAHKSPSKPNESKPTPRRKAKSVDPDEATINITPPEDDVFLNEQIKDIQALQTIDDAAKSKGFPFAKIAMVSFGLLISLSVGLWIDALITELFSATTWLGWIGAGIVVVLSLTLFVLTIKELLSIRKLRSITKLRSEITNAPANITASHAKQLIGKITKIISHKPETAKGRQTLSDLEQDIIDGPALLALTESELFTNLDDKATQIITASAKRVSVVTAISPRAIIDTGYVLYEMVRLTRQIANLYGTRPSFFGTLKLLKSVAAHLAVTGAISVGDGIVQQLIGHGLAAKISARFGEGLVNGLMTTRFGIAAMDVSRPMPFKALSQPKLGDFLSELNPIKDDKIDKTIKK